MSELKNALVDFLDHSQKFFNRMGKIKHAEDAQMFKEILQNETVDIYQTEEKEENGKEQG